MYVYRRHLTVAQWKTFPYCRVLSLPPLCHPLPPLCWITVLQVWVCSCLSANHKSNHVRDTPILETWISPDEKKKLSKDKSTGVRGLLCSVEVHGWWDAVGIVDVKMGAIMHSQRAVIYWLAYNSIEKHCLWLFDTCMLNHCRSRI